VDWADVEDPAQPVSALATGGQLFVVLLDRDYMKVTVQEGKDRVQLPLDARPRAVRVRVRPPPGVKVLNAVALSGKMIDVEADGAAAWLECRVGGGGDLITCNLSGVPAGALAQAAEKQKADEKQKMADVVDRAGQPAAGSIPAGDPH
jgi:hypothetical protein